MIREKLFREDLFYRISVFPITIPPLRERTEDIPLLVNHFILKYGKRLNPRVKGVSQAGMEQLMQYSWPGNIRELENIVQRSLVSAGGDKIDSFPFLGAALSNSVPAEAAPRMAQPDIAFDATYHELKDRLLEQFEKSYLRTLLEKHHGVIAEAARESGLNYKTFYLKAEHHNLLHKRKA
jgi:DNA-binding NtrC family response regulator